MNNLWVIKCLPHQGFLPTQEGLLSFKHIYGLASEILTVQIFLWWDKRAVLLPNPLEPYSELYGTFSGTLHSTVENTLHSSQKLVVFSYNLASEYRHPFLLEYWSNTRDPVSFHTLPSDSMIK